MRFVIPCLLLLGLICCSGLSAAQQPPSAGEREKLVKDLMEAFNKQDADAMARLVTADIQWINLEGTKFNIEANSRDDLHKGMTAYFRSCPTCRSSFAGMLSTPNRVTAIEVAEWQKDGAKRTQRSVSVYEFSGALISRVYYFPSERP